MRIKDIHIRNYKNLKDFRLTYDGESFVDIFVGKNGSGKSNFFEALIEMFQHLYEPKKMAPSFEYTINYSIEDKDVGISWGANSLTINGETKRSIDSGFLPDNVLIYYSGHNKKVTDLVQLYEKTFKKAIKHADNEETRKFIGINKDYKQLVLCLALIQRDNKRLTKYLTNKLGINRSFTTVTLVLKRPYWASRKTKIDLGDVNTHYWGALGITRCFLDRLSTCESNDPEKISGYNESSDTYKFHLDIRKIQKEFRRESSQDLFRQFDNLKTIEMLNDLSISIELNDGTSATTEHFSDGQFQLVYIYSIIEFFKDRNCVILLDEPDSFLHPEWQFQFLKQIYEISSNASSRIHLLISSHSAATLISHIPKRISLFEIVSYSATQHPVNKRYAIKQLSADLIKYSEDEQNLNILNRIRLEEKPVFLTEGLSDAAIIETAWSKLYQEPIPFIPLFSFGCDNLRRLILDEKTIKMINKPLFCLFDFDAAYNQWSSLKKEADYIECESDFNKGLCSYLSTRNIYAFMLPVPTTPEVRKLVVDKTSGKTFEGESRMSIEHLFYGDKKTHKFFNTINLPGEGKALVIKDKNKVDFASNIVPQVDPKHFQIFRPMFDLIRSKCSTSS